VVSYFNRVATHLNQQHAAEVEDIITAPTAHDRLKGELVSRLSTSREQRV
jgi:hypothetical protein